MTRLISTAGKWVLLMILFHGVGCSVPQGATLTPEERELNMAAFDEVWGTINDEYWDPEFRGLDWAAIREELRPKMESARSREEARDILYDMFMRLGLSHYMVLPKEALDLESEEFAPDQVMGEIGVDLRVLDGRALVTAVYEGFAAEKAGVKTGWEVIRVDGVDVVARLKERDERIDDDVLAKPLHMTMGVLPLLMGAVGSTVEVGFLDGKGREQNLALTRNEPRGNESRLGHLTGLFTWIEVRELDGGVGYIAFNGFYDPLNVMKAYNEALERFLHAPGLIIDLRGNPGGMGEMAMGMLGWLVDEKFEIGTMCMREDKLTLNVRPRPETYQGPLAVLVDNLSGSASEFFSNGLQEMGRARIFGTRTKGEALPGQIKKLPTGDLFVYATADFITANGKALEGVGVIPDFQVDHTREALLQGRDRVIEAALDWIQHGDH